MKLASRNNTVLSGGSIGEDSNFSIDVNAKMFRVLSDTMYQDKVGSMVRELSCNAMDAHAMAGEHDKPFTIHVPDQLEPWFSVKDEGVGLSDSELRTMYTTYGRSTKDDNNDVVGAFGLGSKTPFAYTDQFTVTSIYEGVKRIYVAVMNDEGLPVLKLQGEAETSEHPGLEINVSVRDTDYSAFRDAIIQQLKFFKVKPTLLNNRRGIEYPDLDQQILIDRAGIRVYEGGYNRPLRGIWIVQGGVGYPLSMDRLGDLDSNVKAFARAIEDKGAILEFPIGQIEVTASREGLSYTEAVCQRIVKRISDVASEICKEAMDEIRKMDNIWQRAAFYNDQLDVVQRAIRQAADFDKLFVGAELDRHDKMILDISKLDAMGFKAVYMMKYSGYSRAHGHKFVKLVRKTVTNAKNANGNFWHDTVHLYPEPNLHIFVRDTNSKPVARIKKFAEDNDYPSILLIEGAQADIEDKDIKQIAKALSMPVASMERLSKLEAPKVVRGASGSTARPRAFQMPQGSTRYVDTSSSREWTPLFEEIDDIGPAIYVSMDRHDIDFSTNTRLVLEAAKNELLDMPVIAVNQQTKQRIEDGKIGDELIAAEEKAKEILDTLESLKPVFRAYAKYEGFLQAMHGGNGLIRNLLDSGLVRGVSSVSARKTVLASRIGAWMFAQNRADNDTTAQKEAGLKAGQQRRNEIFTRYPMLKHMQSYGVDKDTLKDIEAYMKMVDERG